MTGPARRARARRWMVCSHTAVWLGVLSSSPRAEAADPPPVTHADALFAQAVALRSADRYAEACPKFDESRREAPAVGVTLHLADCYAHLGRKTSAYLAFRGAEELAHARHDHREPLAAARADALAPTLNTLTVVLKPGVLHDDEALELDGLPLRRDQCNLRLQVDPGLHTLRVTPAAGASRQVVASVAPDDPPVSLTVTPREAPSSGGPPAAATDPSPAPPSLLSGSARRNLGLALLGVGGAGLALGTGFLVVKNAARPNEDDTAAALSTLGFALGGAAIAGALVVYLTAPLSTDTALVLAPMTAPGGGGALLRGTF